MIIMGLDPGLATIGYAFIKLEGSSYRPLHYGAIITQAQTPINRRLEEIYQGMTQLIDKYQPDELAIEELFFNKNVKTAIAVAQARGVELLAGQRKGLPIYEYTPLQVKQGLVGYGRASKSQVQQMVKLLLHLEEVPKPDDVADALAIALIHGQTGNRKEAFRLK